MDHRPWRKEFRLGGPDQGSYAAITIGAFPALTVLAARQQALSVKAAVVTGNDPSEQRKNEQRELTFATLAARYID